MPWNASNPLYRWKQKQGKLNKSVKVKASTVTKMVRRRRYSPRRSLRRYSPRRRFRSFRRGKAPASILTMLPLANALFIEPVMGDGTRAGALAQMANPAAAVQEYLNNVSINFTGYNLTGDGRFWGWQYPLQTYGTIIGGAILSKALTKLGVNRHMSKIPFVGKYIKL